MSSSQGRKAESAANEPTTQEIESWDKNKLLLWIQQKLSTPLEPKDAEKVVKAVINGSVFLKGAGDRKFFQSAGLTFGASVELAELARKAIGSKSRCCHSTLYTLCRQPANNATGDNQQASSPSKKKRRLNSEIDEVGGNLLVLAELQKLAKRARERRDQIREKFKALGHLPDDADQLPNAAVQLSNPAFHTKLPFPFVGSAVPTRFKIDSDSKEKNWFYTGREMFMELLDRLRHVRKSDDRTALWVYGTKGYGKSYLLAALVCYLTAQEERVVYIPECRECFQEPVEYVRAAMLFAWADDKAIQDEIITLDTQEKIRNFFRGHPNTIIFIDQVNGSEGKEWDDHQTRGWKGEVKRWLDSCRVLHTTILSTSANYKSYLETAQKESTEETIHVYGGFTKVSLSKE